MHTLRMIRNNSAD